MIYRLTRRVFLFLKCPLAYIPFPGGVDFSPVIFDMPWNLGRSHSRLRQSQSCHIRHTRRYLNLIFNIILFII